MFRKWGTKKPATTFDLNDIIDYIDKKTMLRVTGAGVRHKRGDNGNIVDINVIALARAFGLQIAKVHSDATGGGYYNCYLQNIDATYWDTNTDALINKPGRVRTPTADGVAGNEGGGEVSIPSVAHGIPDGTAVTLAGFVSSNYNGAKTVSANSVTDEIWITATYAAETFTGSETITPDADEAVILNLAEVGTSNHDLVEGDVITCWKQTDDEGNSRLVGMMIPTYTEC